MAHNPRVDVIYATLQRVQGCTATVKLFPIILYCELTFIIGTAPLSIL